MSILRIIYKKEGKASFISSNYIGKIFERAIRRLGIPLIFSQGYTRKLKISLGPPLAVGVIGMNEVIDVHIGDLEMSVVEVREKLNGFLPEGLVALECRYLRQDEKSPPEIKIACYTVRITDCITSEIPDSWQVVSRKDDTADIIIPLDKFKHKDLFSCFGTENVIKRVLIF